MGQIIGGVIAIGLLTALVRWALMKRLVADRAAAGLYSVPIAYLIAVIAYGFGSADGGSWRPTGLIIYLPGAIIIALFVYFRSDGSKRGYR